jgi:hypothetical protein
MGEGNIGVTALSIGLPYKLFATEPRGDFLKRQAEGLNSAESAELGLLSQPGVSFEDWLDNWGWTGDQIPSTVREGKLSLSISGRRKLGERCRRGGAGRPGKYIDPLRSLSVITRGLGEYAESKDAIFR